MGGVKTGESAANIIRRTDWLSVDQNSVGYSVNTSKPGLHIFITAALCIGNEKSKRIKVNLGFRYCHCASSRFSKSCQKSILATHLKCLYIFFCKSHLRAQSLRHNTKLHLMSSFCVISSKNKWASKSLVAQTSGWHTDSRCCSSAGVWQW